MKQFDVVSNPFLRSRERQLMAGSMLIMSAARYFSFHVLGVLIALAVATSTLFLVPFPQPAKPVMSENEQ